MGFIKNGQGASLGSVKVGSLEPEPKPAPIVDPNAEHQPVKK